MTHQNMVQGMNKSSRYILIKISHQKLEKDMRNCEILVQAFVAKLRDSFDTLTHQNEGKIHRL